MKRYNYSRDSNNANHDENYSKAFTPIPEYRVITEGYEWTFNNRDMNGSKGPRPLQYMTLHVQRRAHSSYENTPGLWDIFMHPLYMNPEDADARNLKDGDAAVIQGEAGATLRNVHVSELIRPGHCAMGQGAWVDLDTKNGIDRAGSTNALFATRRISGQGQLHLQSTPVEVKKWSEYPIPAKKLIVPVEE
jgi:anaerobic dimethyl sulfoxide reductase subunit A